MTTYVIDFISVEDSTIDIENDIHPKDTPTPTPIQHSMSTKRIFKNNAMNFLYNWPKTS
jgi:hypothetical protein